MQQFAMLFPGQGAQFVGMGRNLAAAYPVAAEVFAQADDILGFALSRLCFHGPEQELNDTVNAQPAIFVTSIAAWQVFRWLAGSELQPHAIAGHSLGEYSALVAAGALDFADALRLVRIRGQTMQQAGTIAPGGMLAVIGLDLPQIEQLAAMIAEQTGQILTVANDNCPGQVVVAGEPVALEVFAQACMQQEAAPPTRLKVSVAPHTPLMQPALPAFQAALAATPIAAPNIPLVGNVSATWLRTATEVRHELGTQLTHRVRWHESMQCLIAEGVDTMVEVAPGKVLSNIIRFIKRSIRRINIGDDLATLTQLEKLLANKQ